MVQVLSHLVDRCDDHVCVQVQEGGVVAHLLSLLPVEKDFPQTDGVLVYLLKVLKVISTRQLVLRHLLLRVLVIFVEKLQELSVKNDLRPNLMNSLRPLEELLKCVSTIIEPARILEIGLDILFLEGLDLLAEYSRTAVHDPFHGLLVLGELLG